MDWTGFLQLCPDDLRQLSSRDFLNRLKLTSDFDLTCRAKLKRSQGEKLAAAIIDELVTKARENFATEARGYIVTLLVSLLRDIHFTANIVHGMGSFDAHVLLTLPLEQVTFCFNALFDSFRLRGWVDESSKDECRDEYFEFMGYFRNAYPSIKTSPGTIAVMLDFLVPIPAFRTRRRLFHLFRLCCLWEEHYNRGTSCPACS